MDHEIYIKAYKRTKEQIPSIKNHFQKLEATQFIDSER